MAAPSKPQLTALHTQILIELSLLEKSVSLATVMTGVNVAYVIHAGEQPKTATEVRGACLELQYLGYLALDMKTGDWSITESGKTAVPKDAIVK